MTTRPGIKEALRMAAGAAILLAVVLVALRFQDDRNPAEQLAAKAARADLVARMQLALASASEAEKSAVLAVTDEDSKTYADQARAAMAGVERERRVLTERLQAEGTQGETDALTQFSELLVEVRRIDDGLLGLAVRNSNLKATALAFGPAADAVREMSDALDRVAAANAGSPDAGTIALLARGAQMAALRIETLLPPHIAEESDAKMDELEVRMTKDDEAVRRELADLAALPGPGGNADLAAAASGYARFSELRTRILALSRENTNVRSLSISLGQKQKAMRLCRDALATLRQEIDAEPVPGLTHGPVPKPR